MLLKVLNLMLTQGCEHKSVTTLWKLRIKECCLINEVDTDSTGSRLAFSVT